MNDKDITELKLFINQELRRHTAALYWELSKLPLTYDDRVRVYQDLLLKKGQRYPKNI